MISYKKIRKSEISPVNQIAFTTTSDVMYVQNLAHTMIKNIAVEISQVDKLDIVLAIDSPVLVNQILNDDDPVFCFSNASIIGRLQKAKIKALQTIYAKYWEYLFEHTSKRYYPHHVCHFEHTQFFRQYRSNGVVVYPNFNYENVLSYLKNFVIQPYSEDIAKTIILQAKDAIQVHRHSISIQPFHKYFSGFNREIKTEDVISAVLFLHHGQDEDWLIVSRLAKTCFDNTDKSCEYFSITHRENSTTDIGAELPSLYRGVIKNLISA